MKKSLPHLQKQLEFLIDGSQSMTGKLTLTPALSFSPDPPAAAPCPAPLRTLGRMHCGRIETSKRLQATLAVLQDGEWHTTREIRLVTNSEAVHSDINALRAGGIVYESKCMPGRIWKYRLAPR